MSSKLDDLRKKAASVSADLDPPVERPSASRPVTVPGIMTHGVRMGMHQEIERLQSRLAQYDGADPVRYIDPSRVRPSQYSNRLQEAYADEAFQSLRSEIERTGGNLEPATVRPLDGDPDFDYELASGHRRHAATLSLGLPLLARIKAMTDIELLRQMDAENSEHSPPSHYELGLRYKQLLENKTFSSRDELIVELKLQRNHVHRCLQIVSLDRDIILAFPSPRDIRARWINTLGSLMSGPHTQTVREVAKALRTQEGRTAAYVYQALLGATKSPSKGAEPQDYKFVVGGRIWATARRVDGRPAFVLDASLPQEKYERIKEAFEATLQEHLKDAGDEA